MCVDITTPLITHRDHVSHAFDLFCRMRKSSTPPHSIHVWLVQLRGDTRPRAFSFSLADADADLAMLSCTTFSLFISLSLSRRTNHTGTSVTPRHAPEPVCRRLT